MIAAALAQKQILDADLRSLDELRNVRCRWPRAREMNVARRAIERLRDAGIIAVARPLAGREGRPLRPLRRARKRRRSA